MSIDCSQCEPVLLDLCYGELAPQHERDVRTHILDCPTCRKALSRLEAGQALARHLPDEAPPPEMTERILRAAQIHVRRNSGSWLERVQLVIESMARIAMTRQAAMVTLSLLIVFVGLWSYPELTRRREAHPTMVVAPTHGGEAESSSPEVAAIPTPEPSAVPLEEPMTSEAQNGKRSGSADTRIAAAEGLAKRGGPRERSRPDRATSGPTAAVAKTKRAEARAQGRFAPPPPNTASKLETDDVQPSAAKETEASRADEPGEPVLGDAPATTAEAAPQPAAPVAAAAAAPPSLEEVFKAGVEHYRAENFAAAAQLFARMLESSAPSAQRAAALLYLGRSERALGRCDRAIRAYETLVRSYGSAQQSSSALSEGIACYDQLGDTAGATRLLEHASSVPSLSVQASRIAQERSAGKPADPPAAAPDRP